MIIFDILFLIFLLGFIFWVSSHLFSSIFYVPYVNSSDSAIHDALKLAGLKKGDNFLDLGCGRGDALIVAARDFGAKAVGYEISPFPYLLAKIRTRRHKSILIFHHDFKNATKAVQNADVIYLYLLNSVLDKIEGKIFDNSNDRAKIVTLAFKFVKHQPTKIIETKNLGRETNIYLYSKNP